MDAVTCDVNRVDAPVSIVSALVVVETVVGEPLLKVIPSAGKLTVKALLFTGVAEILYAIKYLAPVVLGGVAGVKVNELPAPYCGLEAKVISVSLSGPGVSKILSPSS